MCTNVEEGTGVDETLRPLFRINYISYILLVFWWWLVGMSSHQVLDMDDYMVDRMMGVVIMQPHTRSVAVVVWWVWSVGVSEFTHPIPTSHA